MSVTRAQLIGNVSTGASFSGIVTATTFIGNLTGNHVGDVNSSGVSTFVSLRSTNVNATGVVTATTFSGNLTGNVTGNATGLSGNPSITVNNVTSSNINSSGIITATEFDISGSSNSLTAGGLNVGVVTATRLIVGSAVTITTNGLNTVGVITANDYDGNFILDSYLFN